MPIAPAYLTPDQLRTYVTTYLGQGVDFTLFSVPQLTNLILQASTKIDGFLYQSLMLQNVYENQMGRGTNFLHLRRFPIWVGLATVLTVAANPGDTSITVADCTGLLAGSTLYGVPGIPQGQLVNIVDPVNTNEPQNNISPAYVPGSLTVQLQQPLKLFHPTLTTVYVYGVDTIQIILPQQVFPIPSNVLVIQQEYGIIQNYTPLMFQQLGYSTIFPKNVPLRIQYTWGYLPGQYPWEIVQTCVELCISTVKRNPAIWIGGISKQDSTMQSETYFDPSKVSELTLDQKDRLIRFRRGRGMA